MNMSSASISTVFALRLAMDSEIHGLSLSVLLPLIVVSAIVQDDFTCLIVGVYISAGDLPALPAIMACIVGTLLGDFVWYFSGMIFGRTCLERRPIRWLITSNRLEQARAFFERHGPMAILITRFMPVIRTPLQLAAGAFAPNAGTCLLWLTAGALIYAPVLVLISALMGRVVDVYSLYEQYGHMALLGMAGLLWLMMTTVRCALRFRKLPD